MPTAYFARNPNLLRTRGSYERLADDDNALNTVWPVRPNPGTNRAYQAGIDRPDGSLAQVHLGLRAASSIAATGCRRISTATCSSRSRRPTW